MLLCACKKTIAMRHTKKKYEEDNKQTNKYFGTKKYFNINKYFNTNKYLNTFLCINK